MLHIFAHPGRLWLLSALAPLAGLVALGWRRRARDWAALAQSGRPPGDGAGSRLVAAALLIVAIAQPRWGRSPGAGPPPGHDVVLLVDVSRSMAAEDAVPDRLAAAIGAGSGLIRALAAEPGNRVAVVAFAARGVVRSGLTADLDAAAEALRSLRPGDVQPGGTDLGAALVAAAGAFDDEEHAEGRTIVVLSDGEDHAGSWAPAAGRLREAGIIVHSVAIGDPDRGHPIPGPGRDAPKKGRAPATVETRRSDVALEAVARATRGAFVPIGLGPADLGALFRDRIAPTARRLRDDLRLPERVERFPAFAIAALGIGLAGSWPGPARRRGLRLSVTVAALVALSIGAGPGGATPSGLVAEGRTAYDSGRFAEALDAFRRAAALDPAAAVPRYDAAAALFQLRRHAEALARYEEARDRADGGLATRIDYAEGNALLALGDVPGAIARYDACVASTWPGPAFDAVRRDAATNRAFAASRSQPPPPEPGGNPRPPASNKPRPPPKRGADGKANADGPATSDPSGATPDGGPSDAPGRRGPGGAGGGGESPAPGASPDAQLDAALRDVGESRRLRPPDPPPAASAGSARDW